MSILVTGGAGFIGSQLLRSLGKFGERLVVADKISYAGKKSNLPDNVEFYKIDIASDDAVRYLFEQETFDTVFHLAAESHVDNSINNPKPFIDTNVIGTVNLLQASLEHEVDRFMHISTDEVFGSIDFKDGSFNEESRYQPRNPYSASKAASDHFVNAYNVTYGLPTTITNCSNNYGPRQDDEKMIPTIIRNIKNGTPIPVYGDGQQVRDWIYVEDHCDALIELWINGKVGERYNIGGECELKNIDLVKMICKLMSKEDHRIEHVTDRPGHDLRYSTSNKKITTETKWSVSTDITTGLLKTILYYEDN
jgi:dTDP-glucose 4,6-dehydratase